LANETPSSKSLNHFQLYFTIMKHILLFFAAISIGFAGSAQSFELLGTSLVDTVYFKLDGFSMDGVGYLKNTTADTITMDCFRNVNNTATGHTTNFCFGPICYDPDANFSTFPLQIAPGATDSSYKVTLSHLGNVGETIVEMLLNNSNNSDQIRHTIHFLPDPTSSISRDLAGLGYSLSLAGANPVTTTARMQVEIPTGKQAKLVLTDLTGRTLHSQQVRSTGNVEIPVYNLSAGVYMTRLEVNDQATASIKLVKN
jgi:hypothetical protein